MANPPHIRPKCLCALLTVCYKPTSRLAQFASLGIPVVTYPFVSYMDVLVEFGYPLVAETLEEVCTCEG